ncbi:MAG: hypothetical protein KDH92_08295, partial [Chloroflexi bacterium]|nr:hypothetical protein [Chloroflexota bacterium]
NPDGLQPSWTQLLDSTSGASPDRTWLLPDRTQPWFTPDGSGLLLTGDADAGQPGLRLLTVDPDWLAARRAWLPRILRSAEHR